MEAFPLVVQPYEANTFPYTLREGDPSGMPSYKVWIAVFRKSMPTYERHALADSSTPADRRPAATARFMSLFNAVLDRLEADPDAPLQEHPGCHPLSCASLCAIRERVLREVGLGDIFSDVKREENAGALRFLPEVLAELDSTPGGASATRQRLELALRGVLAGNIFDLGAAASAERYASGASSSSSFTATRNALLPRPWAVDDLDLALDRLAGQAPYRHVLMFVDNSGADVILGMLPLARELLKSGAKVVLAANKEPSINDITAAELVPVLQQAAVIDPQVIGQALKTQTLLVMSSGNALPVIDLSKVSSRLCEYVRQSSASETPVDLVVLEGMGRGIETNLYAQLSVDCIKLAMIKHPEVAQHLRGRLYDGVIKFTPGLAVENGHAHA